MPDGSTFRLGRNQPPDLTTRKKLRFSSFMTPTLPTAPPTCDYRVPAVAAALADIYGNDQLGDCVIAGLAHMFNLFEGNAGLPVTRFTLQQLISMYSAIGGYVPDDPSTDNGCDENTALTYVQKNGFLGHHILGSMSVDATNSVEMRQALWLFENLMYGVGLPDAWISPFPSASGFTWDVAGASDPNNGHCFVATAYTPGINIVDTWGLEGNVTDAASAAYAVNSVGGQLFAVITPEILNRATQRAPNGMDWYQITRYFYDMRPAS